MRRINTFHTAGTDRRPVKNVTKYPKYQDSKIGLLYFESCVKCIDVTYTLECYFQIRIIYGYFLLNGNRPTELIKSHAFYLVSDVGCYFEMDNTQYFNVDRVIDVFQFCKNQGQKLLHLKLQISADEKLSLR